ncbi:MAG TPA: hypothetical protein VJS30_25705 [Paraburkholderia sp.]|nr:hypothetical protein [Paraburkholderia sp.]
MTQGHDQHGAIAQENHDARHRPTTFVFVKVHPGGGPGDHQQLGGP